MHHGAVRLRRIEVGQVVGQRLAGHREAVAVQQTLVQQGFHDHWHAADLVEVDHVELAVRLHVGDVGDLPADPVEVLQREIDTRLVGDGQQVQHRVGGSADGHGDGDGV